MSTYLTPYQFRNIQLEELIFIDNLLRTTIHRMVYAEWPNESTLVSFLDTAFHWLGVTRTASYSSCSLLGICSWTFRQNSRYFESTRERPGRELTKPI